MARLIKPGDRFLRGKQVRLMGPDSEQIGLFSCEDALTRTRDAGLDLVEIAGKAIPPVCRMMNYGKHQYEESKKHRDQKKKQHQHKVKEIKFHPNIDSHDYQTKLNHGVAFLEKGFKVKVSMFFRGREMAHQDIGFELMQRVIEDTTEVATLDAPPRRTGRLVSMMLSSKTKK